MTGPTVQVVEDAAALAGETASRLLARLEEVQAAGRVPHVCLTGGGIADLVHRELARRTDTAVDWSRVELWWGDERFLTRDDEERNAVQARRALLDHVPVDPARVHEVASRDDVADVEAAAAAYAEELATSGPERFDVVMLGLGPDGHVASLFPGHGEVHRTGSPTVAVHGSPKPPPERVSLTFERLNAADAVWVVVSGRSKAAALAAALEPGEVMDCPARGVHGDGETLWLVDAEAGAGAAG